MFLEGLDALDQRIVQLLIENARMSYSDIGQAVGISRVAVKARIQALEENNEARVLGRPSVLTVDNIQATLENTTTYYVEVEGAGLYECRAKGIFRNKKMKPNVGDIVDIDVISEEEKTGNLTVIHKRKNQLIRPMVANVDQALVIFAVHEPEPNFQLLNRFLIMMEKQQIPVIICFNKMDLASEEEKEQLRQDYENSGC